MLSPQALSGIVLLLYLALLVWWLISLERSAPMICPARCPWPADLPGTGFDCGGPCAVEPPCMDAGEEAAS